MYSQDYFVCNYRTCNIMLHKLTSFVILSLCFPLGIINLVRCALINPFGLLEHYILKWTSPKNAPETSNTCTTQQQNKKKKTPMNKLI